MHETGGRSSGVMLTGSLTTALSTGRLDTDSGPVPYQNIAVNQPAPVVHAHWLSNGRSGSRSEALTPQAPDRSALHLGRGSRLEVDWVWWSHTPPKELRYPISSQATSPSVANRWQLSPGLCRPSLFGGFCLTLGALMLTVWT